MTRIRNFERKQTERTEVGLLCFLRHLLLNFGYSARPTLCVLLEPGPQALGCSTVIATIEIQLS